MFNACIDNKYIHYKTNLYGNYLLSGIINHISLTYRTVFRLSPSFSFVYTVVKSFTSHHCVMVHLFHDEAFSYCMISRSHLRERVFDRTRSLKNKYQFVPKISQQKKTKQNRLKQQATSRHAFKLHIITVRRVAKIFKMTFNCVNIYLHCSNKKSQNICNTWAGLTFHIYD